MKYKILGCFLGSAISLCWLTIDVSSAVFIATSLAFLFYEVFDDVAKNIKKSSQQTIIIKYQLDKTQLEKEISELKDKLNETKTI